MSLRKNQKGMTLVEIIVVLLISSIIMLICGTFIVNSMGFFQNTTDANIDKLAGDKIAQHLRTTLSYAKDVIISDTKPEELDPANPVWHSISLSDDHTLLIDEEEQYSIGFYNHRDFRLYAARYTNDYRMDIKVVFEDEKDKIAYQTQSTLELINMKSRDKEEQINTLANTTLTEITNTMRIYFEDGNYDIRNDPDPEKPEDSSGTVKDELRCKTPDNTLEFGNESGNKKYPTGTYVYYEGHWYRAIGDVGNNSAPSDNNHGLWKLLEPYWSSTSSYEKGDVVTASKGSTVYYQCIADIKYDRKEIPVTNTKYWKKLSTDELDKIKEEHNSLNYCKVESDEAIGGTVGEEVKCITTSNSKPWVTYDNTNYTTYPRGTYVEYPTGSKTYYKVVAIWGSNNTFPPDSLSAAAGSWKKVEVYWNKSSNYELGDFVVDPVDNNLYKYIDIAWPRNSNYTPSVSVIEETGSYWQLASKEEAEKVDVCRVRY